MNKEEQRLLTMFQENKISESDYQMLHKALNKKSLCTVLKDSVLISLVGVYANIFIDGCLGYMIPLYIKTSLPVL